MNVLVAYGSERGGTRGLAEMLALHLRQEGCDVVVSEANRAADPDDYDAIVVGGALYASHWHPDARRFVRRFATELHQRPVYFFSSGPLDDSARTQEIPPTKQVAGLMEQVGARGHVTFGGRLTPGAHGLVAHAMAKQHSGDWRNDQQVREFATRMVNELRAGPGAGDSRAA